MAFSASGFALLDGNGSTAVPKSFGYTTADDFSTVAGAGYFNSVSAALTVGDQIWVYETDNTALRIFFVAGNSGGTVTVTSDIPANTNYFVIPCDDVTTAITHTLCTPFAGTITSIGYSVDGTSRTGTLGITVKTAGGTNTVDTISIADTEDAYYTAEVTDSTTVAAADDISIEFDGTPSAGGTASVVIGYSLGA